MEITWLGHSCFKLKTNGFTFLLDPFLEGTEFTVNELFPDVVLVTHAHSDHLGAAAEFDATLVSTPEVAGYLEEKGCECVDLNLGGTTSFGDINLHMTKAFHSSSIDGVYGGMPAGFVVDGDYSVYHAGDTCLFSDMRETIKKLLKPDIALLPIGDHYTMGPESASVAAEWLDVDVVIPMHYNTFPVIEQDPEKFIEKLPPSVMGLKLDPGESFEF